MNRAFTVGALAALSLFTAAASAQPSSIGTYSGCKKLSGRAKTACLQCVEGGNFYQTKSATCGLAPGMKASTPVSTDAPPARPKAMPATGTKYVTVPAGTFRIGASADEEGVRNREVFDATVTITRPFMMKTTEVTQGEWYFVMGETTRSFDAKCGLDCAVGHVSWRRSLEYLNALSKREGLEPCYDIQSTKVEWTKGLACMGYRLPTEAEWEYAARGGTTTSRYGELDTIGWYADNSGGAPRPVGKKAANAYGLHDMLGSQWEWTWDVEDLKNTPFAGAMRDPMIGGLSAPFDVGGTDLGSNHIVRGGSYRTHRFDMRAGHRYQFPTNSGSRDFGFRPVRTAPAAK